MFNNAHSRLNLAPVDVSAMAQSIAARSLNDTMLGYVPLHEKWEAWCVNGCHLSHFEDYAPVYCLDQTKDNDLVFPEISELLAALKEVRKYAIRLLKLAPGGVIKFHVDDYEKFDGGHWRQVRKLHLPIISNEFCRNFEESADGSFHSFWLEPGSFWHLDGTRVHGACNFGNSDRWHLVIEIEQSNELEKLLSHVESTDVLYGCRGLNDLIERLTSKSSCDLAA